MANVAQQLARLQLGASGARHRPSRRLNDAPPISSNVSSISLQRGAVQFSLLSTLNCPAQGVLALGDGPEVPINGRTTGFLPSGPVFQVAYAYNKPLLAAVDEEGAVGVVDVASTRRKSRWVGHDNAIFDVIWTQDDAQLLTAAGDLQVRVWDVETAGRTSGAEISPVLTLKGHDMSVKCVRQAPDSAHVVASGGRDGKVLLWDTRAPGKPVAALENVHAEPTTSRASSPNVSFTSPIQKRRRRGPAAPSTSSPRSVTCVEFGATGNEIITAGAVDAVVKFWDIRRINSSFSSVGRGKKKAVAKAPVPIREISCSTREGSRRGISSLTFRKGGIGARS
ncbi:WD40 repeat-containing protein L2DTL [Phytophthora cinnamomi]|uniref:WD40 repeat-containing protein L2DTL n=1 Tax=Phytophthora cinnamomi TaxID=4785 RepID=UPI00355A7801|nr:WD40 repeat-containing protein L2DTL [Phytophthora cinnamomi]